MTLAGFQQALADLVAGPELCREVRAGADVAAVLPGCDLDDRERERLVAVVRDRGMTANCTVYRSNRLTPLVLNLPGTCSALGSDLREVLDRFWTECPTENFVHFLIEAERFVTFLEAWAPAELPPAARDALSEEGGHVRRRLESTLTAS